MSASTWTSRSSWCAPRSGRRTATPISGTCSTTAPLPPASGTASTPPPCVSFQSSSWPRRGTDSTCRCSTRREARTRPASSGRPRRVIGRREFRRATEFAAPGIFLLMRYAALQAFAAMTGCRPRPYAGTAHRADSLNAVRLVPRDSTDSSLRMPRVIREPSVVLFWLKAADTLATDDRADTFDDLEYYTEQIAPALEASGIKLLATNADTGYVSLANHTRRTILLSGLDYPFGYLL